MYLQRYIEQPEQPTQIHLSSIAVDNASLPQHWPLARILAPPIEDDSIDPVQIDGPIPPVPASVPGGTGEFSN